MILYFSGTGNTRHVAQLLSTRLVDSNLCRISADMLRDPAAALIDAPAGDKRVIWAFPTYSWGVPPVVLELIRLCRFGSAAKAATHFMLTTCGDDMGRADRQWRKAIAARGLTAGGAYAVQMPNTYVCMKGFDVDSPDLAAAKISRAAEAVDTIARSIESGGPDILIPGKFAGIKTAVVYPWFCRFEMSPKPFSVHEGCISCGRCAAGCPMQNITMLSGRPAWGDKCALCLRCYHVCPRHAVAYGKTTEGKGQQLLS
ncbi:MAG: EFR1 family ferrodoxin [Muribaculaceae bacterium]|nr:EFR1 family ferrodoxin [Muribaculaceae bacterium]